jgi:hypothetical protein
MIDQRERVGWQATAAPGDMLVRPRQYQPSWKVVEVGRSISRILSGTVLLRAAAVSRSSQVLLAMASRPHRPRLQRREHRLRDIGGAVAAAEFHRLDAVGVDLVDRALDALTGFRRAFQTVLVGEPVQHHRG